MWMTLNQCSAKFQTYGDTSLLWAVFSFPAINGFASGIVLSTVLCGFLMLFTAISALTPQLQLLSQSASVHATELFERSALLFSKKALEPESMSAIPSPEPASTATPLSLNSSDSIRCLSVTLVGFPQSCPMTGLPSTSVGQRALEIKSRMNVSTEPETSEQAGSSES